MILLNDNIENKIKPCMWCKRKPEIIYIDHTPPREIYRRTWGYIICCPRCNIETFEGNVEEGVIQYWNNIFGDKVNE